MKTKNVVTNTTEQARRNPLMAALLGTNEGSNAIEASEARGQRELVQSEVLPARINTGRAKSIAALEAAGVVFGDPVNEDPIFVHVTLPAGWLKRVTDHAMWSHLVDDKGRKRASIFYKAAFYDRSAHMSVETRFSLASEYQEGPEGWRTRRTHAKDGDAVVFSSQWHTRTDEDVMASRQPDFDAAKAWLDENRPGWTELSAYWDVP